MRMNSTLAAMTLAAVLSASPAEAVMPYTPHRCADEAKRHALPLLQSHAKGAGRVALADDIVRQRGTIDVSNERIPYARLEVRGFIDREAYTVTLLYSQSPGPCVPYSHSIATTRP